MGFFKKLAFWKKEDDLGFEELADQEAGRDHLGMGDNLGIDDDLGLDRKPAGLDEKSPFDELDKKSPEVPPPPHIEQLKSGENREFELINSKLDTIRVMLTSLDQRVAGLERPVKEKKEQKLW